MHGVVVEECAGAEGVDCQGVASPGKALVETNVLSLRGIIDRVDREVHGDDTVAPADGE